MIKLEKIITFWLATTLFRVHIYKVVSLTKFKFWGVELILVLMQQNLKTFCLK